MERFSSAEEFLEFYRDNLKGKLEKTSFVYGNSISARNTLEERGTWAVFGKLDSPIYEKSRWALDALKSLEIFLEDPETSNTYESSIDVLSATTLYAVTRAESNGEVEPGRYKFHRSIIQSLEKENASVGDWIEDIEYVGANRDRENHIRAQAIESKMAEAEHEIEQKKEEIDEIERVLDLYNTVIDNSELLAETIQTVAQMQDRIEHLDQVDVAMIQDIADVDSRVEETEENLNQGINELERHYTDLKKDMSQLEENLDTVYESLDGLETEMQDVGELSNSLDDLEASVEELEEKVEHPRERPVIISEDIYPGIERELEDLDERLRNLEEEEDVSESQTTGLVERISQFFTASEEIGKQTTIDDWN